MNGPSRPNSGVRAPPAEAVYTITGAGVVKAWDAGAADLYGIPDREAIGRSFQRLIVPPGGAEREAGAVNEALSHGRSFHDADRRTRDGRTIRVSVEMEAAGTLRGMPVVLVKERCVAPIAFSQPARSPLPPGGARDPPEEPALVAITDESFRPRRLGPGWTLVTGFSPDELSSSSLLDLIQPEDRAMVERELEALASGRGDYAWFEARQRRHDGAFVWVTWDATIDRGVGEVFLVVQTVDAMRGDRAETQLRGMEEELLQALERLGLGLSIVVRDERDEAHIAYVNDAACRLMGAAREEIVGVSPFLFVPPPDEPPLRELEARRRQGADTPRALETVIARRDGTRVKIDVGLEYGLFGDRTAVISVFQDVSNRHEAEALAREADARLHSFIENCPSAVVLLDADGIVRFVSRPLPAFDPPLEVGASFVAAVARSCVAPLRAALDGAFASRERTDLVVTPASRPSAPLACRIGAIEAEGQVKAAVAFLADPAPSGSRPPRGKPRRTRQGLK